MNKKEKDFMESLRVLMIRYSVKLDKQDFPSAGETTYVFLNREEERENEIFVDLSEVMEDLNK